MSLVSFEEKSQTEIDTTINRLAGADSSLAACLLVSKRWHTRNRQQSFRNARLADLQSLGWLPSSDDVHPESHSTNNHAQCDELWISSSIPKQLSRFKSFNRVTCLTLDHVAITLFDFPALRYTFLDLIPTVRNLRLLSPSVCPESLLQFIAIFRNLQVTTIHAPSWVKPDEETPITHFGGFRGALCLSEFDDGSNHFLSLLELHVAGVKKVTISECNFHDHRPLQRFLSSVGRSVQTLRLVIGGNGEVPELSLRDCLALEDVFLSIIGPAASFSRIASLISSVASPHFRSLVLKLRTTAQRERDIVQIDLADRISSLDVPISRLGRVASAKGHKVSVVLLGQDPEFLAQGLVDFHKVGYIWAGEEVGGNEYFWTFTSPENGRAKKHLFNILGGFFRRGD